MKITFTKTNDLISDLYQPIPASKMIPEWYKNQSSYVDSIKEIPTIESGRQTSATIKKCMPVFDAMAQGYLFLTNCDVYVKTVDDLPFYTWTTNEYEVISFHSPDQAKEHPNNNGLPFSKWLNPWAIKTPKGYSVLITSCFHRNNVFQVLEGVVDTDTYTTPISIVFKLKENNFEGLIPAGTPIAQVIPFKREEWVMGMGGEKELQKIRQEKNLLNSKFYDKYKTFFRQKKEYK